MTPEERWAEERLRPWRGLANRIRRLEDDLKRRSRIWRPETADEEWLRHRREAEAWRRRR